MKQKGQGAIEYLLLLAAAVVVVAVVISFMISTIQPTTAAGDLGTYNFLCKTLPDHNSLECGCYLCDDTLAGYTKDLTPNGTYPANSTNCDALATNKGTDALRWTARCPTP